MKRIVFLRGAASFWGSIIRTISADVVADQRSEEQIKFLEETEEALFELEKRNELELFSGREKAEPVGEADRATVRFTELSCQLAVCLSTVRIAASTPSDRGEVDGRLQEGLADLLNQCEALAEEIETALGRLSNVLHFAVVKLKAEREGSTFDVAEREHREKWSE